MLTERPFGRRQPVGETGPVRRSDVSWGWSIVTMDKGKAAGLDDIQIPVRFKLFALWSSVMFFYIYGDYFQLYQPGKLQDMIAGKMDLGPISQGVLLAMAGVMTIPSLMPFLALVLPAVANRWVNIVFGTLYSAIMLLAIMGSGWHYYVLFGLIEATLTALIVWYAWTWPRRVAG